jgi:hypothetical protein
LVEYYRLAIMIALLHLILAADAVMAGKRSVQSSPRRVRTFTEPESM